MLRSSTSPVLTATHRSYGSLWLWLFFRLTPGGQTHQPIFTQNCSNDSRKDDTFAVKITTFHTPWSPGPLKGQKFANFWTWKNFRSIWRLTLEVQRENIPNSSSEPNESGILNGQSGSKKLKYVLKFYIGVHVTWYAHAQWWFSIVSISIWRLEWNISETVRDRDLGQRTTNRKWPIPSPMVTWPMTSRDPERSRSWPQYA